MNSKIIYLAEVPKNFIIKIEPSNTSKNPVTSAVVRSNLELLANRNKLRNVKVA